MWLSRTGFIMRSFFMTYYPRIFHPHVIILFRLLLRPWYSSLWCLFKTPQFSPGTLSALAWYHPLRAPSLVKPCDKCCGMPDSPWTTSSCSWRLFTSYCSPVRAAWMIYAHPLPIVFYRIPTRSFFSRSQSQRPESSQCATIVAKTRPSSLAKMLSQIFYPWYKTCTTLPISYDRT